MPAVLTSARDDLSGAFEKETTMKMSLLAAGALAAMIVMSPATAQMSGGAMPSGSMSSGSMSSEGDMKMTPADMKMMKSCKAMSHSRMMKNAKCMEMMRMHPDMMKSGKMMKSGG